MENRSMSCLMLSVFWVLPAQAGTELDATTLPIIFDPLGHYRFVNNGSVNSGDAIKDKTGGVTLNLGG